MLGCDSENFPTICSKENCCKNCPNHAECPPRYRNIEDFITFTSFQDTHEDEFGNTIGIDIMVPNANPEDEAILSTLFSELMEYLDKINPHYANIVALIIQGYSKDHIFAELDSSPTLGCYEIDAALEYMKKFLEL